MKRLVFTVLIGVVLALVLAPGTSAHSPGHIAASEGASVPGGYIVVLREDVDAGRAAPALARAFGVKLGHVYRHALQGFSFEGSEEAARQMARHQQVAYVEPDGLAYAIAPKWCADNPDHPACKDQDDGDGGESSQVVPWGVTRVGGPLLVESGQKAWVVDTGIDLDHPDLNVDVGRSVNFVTRGRDSAEDGHGHGTHVAGTIGAIDNGIDVVGVAAGNVVVAVRVLDNGGSGRISWIVAGIDHIYEHGAPGDVVNMSLGGQGHWSSLHDAIVRTAERGILFAIAAGNSGADADGYEPAHVVHENVYTISAIDVADCMPSWSNWGNPPIRFAAPGVGVLSTARGGGTTTMSGTSMAASHVAGLLLFGAPGADGQADCDPDGEPDPIAHD